MAKDEAGKWSRVAADRLLYLIAVLGLVLIVVPQVEAIQNTYRESAWVLHSSVELGKAFAVAAILGLVIDRALKNDLVREAVATSLGHLLPERLKPELRWLYDQKVIASQRWDVLLEHDKENGRVTFNGTVRRRVENVSGVATDVCIAGGIDDWFSKFGQDQIIACGWKVIKEENEKDAKWIKIDPKKQAFGTSYGIGKCVALKDENVFVLGPNEVLEVLMSYKLHVADRGMEFLTYRYLLDKPEITIRKPESLHVSVTFSHRDKYDQEIKSDEPVWGHTLERMLLPHQDIKVYWHNVEDVKAKTEKYGLEVKEAI
jgi:hypothetical protein